MEFQDYLLLIPDSRIYSRIKRKVKELEDELKKYKTLMEGYTKIREEVKRRFEEIQKEYGDWWVVRENNEVVIEDNKIYYVEGWVELEKNNKWKLIGYKILYNNGKLYWNIKEKDMEEDDFYIIAEGYL